jgi:hypothetical protein
MECHRQFGARAERPKLFEIGSAKSPRPLAASTGGAAPIDMIDALGKAVFTGKGDETIVATCYKSYEMRFEALRCQLDEAPA